MQTKLFSNFFDSEKSSGIILIVVTIVSIALANSAFQENYIAFWHQQMGSHSLVDWINDGLMTIFFLMIGLELEREIYNGELSNIKNAMLPIVAALGGMLIPAGLYLLLNFGTETQAGAGIPMATDIAFAVGILSLLGNKVPLPLKIFLTALAVIDDLGAILVIAIFYTKAIIFTNLFIALGIWILLFILNRLKVRNLIPYLIGGGLMWFFMLNSGIHATISGVILAFVIPFGNGDEKSTSYILQHALHKPVAFFILPLFALANTCIPLGGDLLGGLKDSGSLGILLGLVIGKPLGILLFAFLGSLIGICTLPNDIKWKHILGTGFLGGIGFTMSIFITLLAYDDNVHINNSKIAILFASFLAGIIGYFVLKLTLKKS